ncbi:MAG: 30S ribosomal protein S13 [archaeon YNP-LCB-003-016]|uniref:30S ribosomal protein S13 n=1 Tax=Candidatus Culexarchaeum yellowstonense TaxID=2928963 RepID=UPI0026E94580|nr:30S ribosomal protein S13 [Candidatus Culexarchaeum yellowstonense]MCR6690957.1 30S ribosomal protein S13 [Candidatus Culexarchaeum yellowstonense]
MAFKHVVRIAGHDLDGSLKVAYALSKIKGVGINLAHIILKLAEVSPHERLGYLPDTKIKRIENIINSLSSQNIPYWLMNRAKDLETGENKHLIGSDLLLRIKSDIEFMKKIKCWKGVRHSLGLKVRGQRTRTTGRTGQTVGVSHKPR